MFYYKFNLMKIMMDGTKMNKKKNFLSPQWKNKKKFSFWRIDTNFF